mgnify:CR=1 FL=1
MLMSGDSEHYKPTKACTKCGKQFPATRQYFHLHKLGKFGLNPQCKGCCSVARQKVRRPLQIETPSGIRVPLTRGQFALIDASDKDLCNVRWYCAANFYAINKYLRQMHRVILSRILGRDLLPNEIVDHIDRNPLNNTRANLRLATKSQNAINTPLNKRNTSGIKGVTLRKNKFIAQIRVNGKNLYLGIYSTAEDASKSYNDAAQRYFADFAITNDQTIK